MENSSYALHIAVGVMIAIIILSIAIYRWREIGRMESSKDEAQNIKNSAEFNAEYEAYDKSLMYGTDVLSCLNKAQNNNQKYVYNNYYGTELATIGKDDREEFFMDVVVKINSPLHDEIKAYYRDSQGKYQRVIGLLATDTVSSNNYNYKVFANITTDNQNHFDPLPVDYYYFKQGKVYREYKNYTDIMWPRNTDQKTLFEILVNDGGIIETNIDDGQEYHLLETLDGATHTTSTTQEKYASAYLSALISSTNLKTQRIVNSEQPSIFTNRDWWYCDWTTAASDFKKRKFKCTEVHYNETNGYIDRISFEEFNS